MRLLDAKRLELVDVRDDAIPRYATLSHTWGDEEITLQELRHMKGRMPTSLDKRKRTIVDKKGFVKVKDAAALAVMRGYSYLWADTCCIDKSSSAELSEAINSMYLWYQQSEECYAFLSDVKSAKEEDWSTPNSSFRSSRWFTRGWTLQELIAPKAVHFYARDWSLLGHKDGPDTFKRIISEVTGIDQEVLDGRIDPLQLSVSARMKWASHRHATRLEDMAYSLMGLFQVNMPLLYGEGHRSFTRLQEEIIQRSDDQSLYAWNSFDSAEEDPDALSGLLAHSPEQFKDMGNIQPLPPSPVYASAPSGMTNHGLRVQLYLRPILEADGVPMEEDYYAILDCFVRVGDLYQCPVIRLRRLSQDQYARLQTKSRKLLPPLQSEFPEYEGYRTIYVRQQPVYYHLPQFRVSPLHMHSDFNNQDRQDYRLTDIFPPRQWNSTTMTMKVKYTRKLQAMGVFRFQSPVSINKKVDIVVGLRRLDAMQWEGWCFQCSCQGNSLESTLSMINQKIAYLIRTKRSVISSGMLRDSLGDDSNLVTDATVEGMQLQGRLYISISMSLKPEIQTTAVLQPFSFPLSKRQGSVFSSILSQIQIDSLRVRLLTGPCSQHYVKHSILLKDVEAIKDPFAVRGKPLPATGSGTSFDHFMKPLHQFLERVKVQKDQAEPDSPINPADELALALFKGDLTDIERLLVMGGQLDSHTSDLYGFGPLHWAVVGGSSKSIHMLLQHGVSPLSVTREGWSAIHVSALFRKSAWIAMSAHDRSVEYLGDLANKRTKTYLETALHLGAAYGCNSELELSDFEKLSKNLLPYAPLFARNKYDETPLHRAAAFNKAGVIQSIVSNCNQSIPDIIDVVDRYGRSPLWHAAATGSCEAMRALLSFYASTNLTDDMARSPLHVACRGGHHVAVGLLLKEGARLSIQTSILGLTAFDYAAMFGHDKCLQQLLIQRLPGHERLLTESQMLAFQNKALHIAASCGSLKCVEMLCDLGADPLKPMDHYLKLDESKSYAIVVQMEGDALSVAEREGHLEIARYCKDHCRRRQFGNDMPTGPSPALDGQMSQISCIGAIYQSDPNSEEDTNSKNPEQQTIGPAMPKSYATQAFSTGSSSITPQHYTSTSKAYRDSLITRPTPPFADQPSRVGNHSATLPAYSSPAYQQFGSQSTETDQPQPPRPATHPRSIIQRQTLSMYSAKQDSFSQTNSTNSYGPLNASRPQSFASIPYSLPVNNRYPSLPVPQVPAQYLSESVPPVAPPPLSLLEYNQPLRSQPMTVLASWVRMLGQLGNPSMLVDDSPTDPELLSFDDHFNGFVYPVRGTEGTTAVYAHGLPVFELATGSGSDSALTQLVQDELEMSNETAENSEAPAVVQSKDIVRVVDRVASSVDFPGSWDRLD